MYTITEPREARHTLGLPNDNIGCMAGIQVGVLLIREQKCRVITEGFYQGVDLNVGDDKHDRGFSGIIASRSIGFAGSH